MDGLANFLLARFAEDKARALAATQGNERYPRWTAEPNMQIEEGCLCLSCFEPTESWDVYPIDGPDCSDHQCWHTMTIGEADARHIAHWDPIRVIADCDAKRKIVDRWKETAPTDSPIGCGWPDARTQEIHETLTDEVLPYLALPYTDHKDYQEAWRP